MKESSNKINTVIVRGMICGRARSLEFTIFVNETSLVVFYCL